MKMGYHLIKTIKKKWPVSKNWTIIATNFTIMNKDYRNS